MDIVYVHEQRLVKRVYFFGVLPWAEAAKNLTA